MNTFELEKKKHEELNERKDFLATKLAETIKDNDFSILSFGNILQSKVADYSAEFSESIVMDGSEAEVTRLLTDLVAELDSPVSNGSDTSSLSFFGKLKSKFSKQEIAPVTSATKIDELSEALQGSTNNLLSTITAMETLIERTIATQHDLSIYVKAGLIRLTEIKEKELPYYQDLAKNDSVYVAQLNEKRELFNKLDRRVTDLRITEQFYTQQVMQIQTIKNTNQALVNKIQSTVNTTLSIWRNQRALGATLQNQKEIMDSQKEISALTGKALTKNADNLKLQTKQATKDLKSVSFNATTLDKQREQLKVTIEEAKGIFIQSEQARDKFEESYLKFQTELDSDIKSLDETIMIGEPIEILNTESIKEESSVGGSI